MLIYGFILSLYLAFWLCMLWVLCRLVAPNNAPLLAAVRVGGVVYYLAVCLLTLSSVAHLVHSIYRVEPWGRYLVLGMGLKDGQDFYNVFVLALWLAIPAGWLAARHTYRNLPF